MAHVLCERYGFDEARIAERLSLTGLTGRSNKDLADELLDHVIRPNVDAIVDDFYAALALDPEFSSVVRTQTKLKRLKTTHRRYLLGLGVGFDTPEYFEERLRVGVAHCRAGVSLPLYQCSYRITQNLLIEYIPAEIKATPETFEALVQFILRITALDMSLAIETYYVNKIGILERSIDEMRGEGEALRRTLRTDTLTGLRSRGFIIQFLKRAIVSARRSVMPLSIVMIDLDHFKRVNDHHGHVFGDKVLKMLAARIQNAARGLDTVGRYGGEEFIVVLEQTDLEGARALAERMRAAIAADPICVDGVTIAMTASFGVAEMRDGDDAESLATRADRALYEAKATGRNRVVTELDDRASGAAGHA